MPVPPEEIRVVGTVKSVSESLIDDSWEAMVEIPEFQRQYDIRFNKVPSYLGEILAKEKGQRVTLTLLRQNQRQGDKNPEKYWGWWWGIAEVDETTGEENETFEQVVTETQQAAVSKSRSIDRAVALKASVELAVAYLTAQQREISHIDVLDYADWFDHWLHTGERLDYSAKRVDYSTIARVDNIEE